MAYFIIGKSHVFISHSRLRNLRSEALKDQTASFKILSTVSEKAAVKAEDHMYAYLCRLQSEDPSKFISEWVQFNLWDNEASENVVDLLYDYCHLHGYAYLSEVREEDENGFPSKHIATDTPPIGRIFALNHWVRPERWWRRYTKQMRGREISIFIDSGKVHQIAGTLENFTVLGENLYMRCAGHISFINKELEREYLFDGNNLGGKSAPGSSKTAGPRSNWHSCMAALLLYALFIFGLFSWWLVKK